MASALEIDGKILHPIKEAAKVVSYSRDYITRLAREEKIIASNVERQWFVDLDSLKQYIETMSLEQDIRKKQLSEERKLERKVTEVSEKKRAEHLKKAKKLNVRAAAVASLVLSFGLIGGFATHQYISSVESPGSQVASTGTAQESQLPLPQPPSSMPVPITETELNEEYVAEDSVSELTQEMRSIGDVKNGILLLPSVGSTTEVAELFSDDVVVRKLDDGTEVVVRVDEEGEVVGNEIPFVNVPVKHEEI